MGEQRRVLIVDDQLGLARQLVEAARRAGAEVTAIDHDGLLAELGRFTTPGTYDLILVDAIALERNRSTRPQPSTPAGVRSRFPALDVGVAFRDRHPAAPVVVYSEDIDLPEVRIPLHQLGDVFTARFTYGHVLRGIADILAGDRDNADPAPAAADYRELGIGPDADLVGAIAAATGDVAVWALINGAPRNDDTLRKRVINQVAARHLGEGFPRSYKPAIGVLRRVLRLPDPNLTLNFPD